jgi:hypothetical protein
LKCGTVCPAPDDATPTCKANGCDFSCVAAHTRCGAECVNTKVDPANCNGCNQACPSVENGVSTCTNGACGVSCDAGYSRCSGACVDPKTDAYNCGGCGTKCIGNRRCVAGACEKG